MPSLIGSSYVTFVLNLSLALDEPVSVSYATEPGTALPGVNYEHVADAIVFEPGETEKTVQVLVYGLPSNDPSPRTFRLRVSPTPGAILESPITEATIYVRDPLIHGSVVSMEALLVDLWHQLTQVVLKKRGLV